MFLESNDIQENSVSVIVHIGYPKTATSWLQKNFFPKVRNAVYYPRRDTFEAIIPHNSLDFDPEKVRESFITGNAEHLILSLEGLVGTTHNFGLNGYLTTEHARRIHSIFPDAKIVLFIRRQENIIASSYVQYIKGGGTYSIEKYLYHNHFKNISGLSLFSFKYFEYDQIIRYYVKLFNEKKVKVYLFEMFSQNPIAFAQKFAEDLHLDVDHSSLDFCRVNPGYRNGVMFLARIVNRFTKRKMLNKHYFVHIPFWFLYSKKFLLWLNKFPLTGTYPKPEKILKVKNLNYIREYYKSSNMKLIKEFGLEQIRDYNYTL